MKAKDIMAIALVAMGVLPTAAEARDVPRVQALTVQPGSTSADLAERATQAEGQLGDLRKAISEHQALHRTEAPGWPCAEVVPVSVFTADTVHMRTRGLDRRDLKTKPLIGREP
jgi:hypothetical protein